MTEPVRIPPSQWRLRHMTVERGIRSAVELHRRLEALGVEISSAQISRLLNERPKRISTELFDALMQVLRCHASDLIAARWEESAGEPAPAAPPVRAPAKRPVRRRAPARGGAAEPTEAPSVDDIAGPKITPLPRPKPPGKG
jgi:DNA-binding Xre family transcriptional regulator